MRSGRGSVAPAAPWPLLSDALRERGYDIMLGIVSFSPLIAFRNVAVTPMIRKSHTMPPNAKKKRIPKALAQRKTHGIAFRGAYGVKYDNERRHDEQICSDQSGDRTGRGKL